MKIRVENALKTAVGPVDAAPARAADAVAAMDASALEREVAGFRAELVPQAADAAARREIETRLAAAVRS